MKRTLRRVAIVGLWFCATAAGAAQPEVVRIASIGFFQGGKLGIGGNQTSVLHEQGILEQDLRKLGIRLEWLPIPSSLGGPGFNEALANSSVDFAAYGDFPAIIAKSGGVDTKLVVPSGRGTNSYVVVRKDSPIRTVADLKGKRVSLQRGRPPALAFSQMLRAHGLKESDLRIVNSAVGPPALVAGDVDALVDSANAFLLEDKGVGRIIASTKNTHWKWRAELFARTEFIRQYPEVTQVVVNAYVKAAHWASLPGNRAAALQLTARNGTPVGVLERDYDESMSWQERWSPLFDPYMTQHYREAIAFAHANKLIRRDVDIDEWFEPRFVRTALTQLHLEGYWSERRSVSAAKPQTASTAR